MRRPRLHHFVGGVGQHDDRVRDPVSGANEGHELPGKPRVDSPQKGGPLKMVGFLSGFLATPPKGGYHFEKCHPVTYSTRKGQNIWRLEKEAKGLHP